jgi:hypothetical protein
METFAKYLLLVVAVLCLTASIDLYYALGLALLALYIKE